MKNSPDNYNDPVMILGNPMVDLINLQAQTFAQQLYGKPVILLDTNIWIGARDALKSKDTFKTECLRVIREYSDRINFTLCHENIREILTQPMEIREGTLEVLGRYGGPCVLMNRDTIAKEEVLALLATKSLFRSTAPTCLCVWEPNVESDVEPELIQHREESPKVVSYLSRSHALARAAQRVELRSSRPSNRDAINKMQQSLLPLLQTARETACYHYLAESMLAAGVWRK